MTETNALPPCNQLSCAPANFLIELHVHILAAVCILQMLKCLHIDTPSAFIMTGSCSSFILSVCLKRPQPYRLSEHWPIAVTITIVGWTIWIGNWMMVSCHMCRLLMEWALTSLRFPDGAFQMCGKYVEMMWSSISGSSVCSSPLPAEGPLRPVLTHALHDAT